MIELFPVLIFSYIYCCTIIHHLLTFFMHISEATVSMRDEIIKLLQSEQLPVEDLPAGLPDYFVALNDDKVVGVIGMERYNDLALLRSMVVHPQYRNRRAAAALIGELEKRALAAGVRSIYLLTETAPEYFKRKGFNAVPRDQVPEAIKSSSEFSHVCPVSATVMTKLLPG